MQTNGWTSAAWRSTARPRRPAESSTAPVRSPPATRPATWTPRTGRGSGLSASPPVSTRSSSSPTRGPTGSSRALPMGRFRSELLVAGAALALTGCGGVDINIPDFDPPHDRMTVIVDGQRSMIAQSGSVQVQIGGVPQLSYSGPLGCKGQYFTDSESDVYFRYTARKAYLLRYSTLYTFAGPPHKAGGQLIWSDDFGDHKITVLA